MTQNATVWWIAGDGWTIGQQLGLGEFPVNQTQFANNGLIVDRHLAGEGFPSPWGHAHEFFYRLRDYLPGATDAYRVECEKAALDLLSLVVGQFLGLLDVEEWALREDGSGGKGIADRPLAAILDDAQRAEGHQTQALVLLRDTTCGDNVGERGPIAALNHPMCLWFPAQGYRPSQDLAGRINARLGSLSPIGVAVDQDDPERRSLLNQLRLYLTRLCAVGMPDRAWCRVLASFLGGLDSFAAPAGEPMKRGQVRVLNADPPAEPILLPLDLEWGSTVTGSCPVCKSAWVNSAYRDADLRLHGGAQPRREVVCPVHGQPVVGLRDLGEHGVFFDEWRSEYVIWDGLGTDLPMPQGIQRGPVQRTADPGRGHVRYKIGNASIVIEGVIRKIDDVLVRRLVSIPALAGTEHEPLPVVGSEARCLDWGSTNPVVRDPALPNRWRVHLRGGVRTPPWETEPFEDPDLSVRDNVTLLLWPGFDDPNWNLETVVYHLRFVTSPAPPRLRVFLEGQERNHEVEPLPWDSTGTVVREFERRVAAIEWLDSQGGSIGYVRPKRRTLDPLRARRGRVALDFGTSNTAVSWLPTDEAGAEPRKVCMDRPVEPLEILAPKSPPNRMLAAESVRLPPVWPRHPAPFWCVPSELVVLAGSQRATIPVELAASSSLESVIRNFKWADREGLLRRHYLRLVLRMALASLRKEGATSVALRATYPLAFGPNRLQTYDEILGPEREDGLIPALSRGTGLRITFEGYANESVAGLQACGRRAGQVQCAVDMGGGTTDLALRWIEPENQGFAQPSLVDSVCIAGSDVLECLLSSPELRDAVLDSDNGRSRDYADNQDEARRAALSVVLRDLRAASPGALPRFWIRLMEGDATQHAAQFCQRSNALFYGVLAYVTRLVDVACERLRAGGALRDGEKTEVAVYLLGQGWNLLRLQTGQDAGRRPQELVKERMESLCLHLSGVRGSYAMEVIVPEAEVDHQPKLATSFGALMLPSVAKWGETGPGGRKTVFGVNVNLRQRDQQGGGCLIHEHASVPLSRSYPQVTIESHEAYDQLIGPLLNLVGEHVKALFGATEEERERFVVQRVTSMLEDTLAPAFREGGELGVSAVVLILEKLWRKQIMRLPINAEPLAHSEEN